MKKPYALLLWAIMLISINTIAQQWNYSALPHLRDANAVKIFAPDHIVIAGGHDYNDSLQSFFVSNDLGLYWNEDSNDCICSVVKSMAFVDTLNGYAVGFNGKMAYTTNSGNSWATRQSPINRDFLKVAYATPLKLVAVGGKEAGLIKQTIVRSADGGLNWSVISDTDGAAYRSVYFIDSLTGFIAGDSAGILKTTDGGINWSPISSPLQRDFYGITFTDASNGFIVGGKKVDSIRTILVTHNGGNSWAPLLDEPGGVLTDISFLNAVSGYIVGDHASFFNSVDSGVTWTMQTIPNTAPTQYFTSVNFYSANLGIIGTRGGYVYLFNNVDTPAVATMSAIQIDTTRATLVANVNTHGYPGNYYFIFSTDGTFQTNGQQTFPINVTSNGPLTVTANILNLIPYTTYYYYVVASTIAGPSQGSVLHFTTVLDNISFQTTPPFAITDSSAQLNGAVSGFRSPVALSFEYGTTTSLGNQIAAVPDTITDTLSHIVSAQLTGLLSNTLYYYRLRGVAAGNVYAGDIFTFFTGTPFLSIQTTPAQVSGDTSATLNGVIYGARTTASILFRWGPTPNMDSSTVGTPAQISDSAVHNIMAGLSGLRPLTLYYYQLVAQTSYGEFSGGVLSFYTGDLASSIRTLPVTNIYNGSADLNAAIERINFPVSLSFEYGTTNSLGNSITANPASIGDTAFHSVTASLTGLQNNTLYYYRIKAHSSTLGDYFGETKTFYTGTDEILNWDFQYWRQDTFLLLDGWNIGGDDYSRVPGHSGYALRLEAPTIGLLGVEDDSRKGHHQPGFFDGMPFHARPDSFTVWLNYSMFSADTGGIAVYLYKDTEVVAFDLYPISGTTNGSFVKYTFPITYSSNSIPDTLIFGILPASPGTLNINSGDFITIDDLSFSSGPAVINGDFENWYPYPHNTLLNWSYLKHVLVTPATVNDTPQISQTSSFGYTGDYAAEIRTLSKGGSSWGGTLSNQLSVFVDGVGSTPVSIQHQSLNLFYKWSPENGDTMHINVSMFKNGTSIGQGDFISSTPVSQFTPLNIPISYFGGSVIPDTALITMSCYKDIAHGISILTVDKLHFDGFVSGIADPDIFVNGVEEKLIRVYPNPASTLITIETDGIREGPCEVQLFDINGRLTRSVKSDIGTGKIEFDMHDIAAGFYVLQLTSGNVISKAKVVVK